MVLDRNDFRHRVWVDADEPTAPFGLLELAPGSRTTRQASHELDFLWIKRIDDELAHHRFSAAALFHAAWALVIARVSAVVDVMYETERLVDGDLLPIRFRLRELSTRQLLEQAQECLQELAARRPERARPRRTGALLKYGDTSLLRLSSSDEPLAHPLKLLVTKGERTLSLQVTTDGRLEPARIIGYMRTVLSGLLEALETSPETKALSVPVLPEVETHQVLRDFNATDVRFPSEKTIHAIFEEQVARTPDTVALIQGTRKLTYREVNDRANQIARYLRDCGVRENQPIALCIERSPEMILGVLGILKAGGAYLPMDPAYPPQRLAEMLDDAVPRVLITQQSLREWLPKTQAKIIALDAVDPSLKTFEATNLPAAETQSSATNLVYVMYTSGSTGKPKGIAMEHRCVVNLIEWHRQQLPTCKGLRVLQFAALSFDVAFQETFTTLCLGGTLLLIDEATRKNPAALAEVVLASAIQRLFLPPLVLQSLAEYFEQSGVYPTDVQDVICAGEQLRISREIAELFTQLPGARLHNHYGPTETHVVSALTLAGTSEDWPNLPSIGRPIANTKVYLLNTELQPVPVGVSGEIYLGGTGVARGYLNRPELTAERFIKDPFGTEPGARLYKTGDLGRWRADGSIDYLGRNDHQVKIRGFRIELGEIDAQIVKHEAVQDAATVVREDVSGEKQLVSYVTPVHRASAALTVEQVRDSLKSALPQHMIPSAIVILERLPLTPNGKLDRRALPAPQLADYACADYAEPISELEKTLAAMWQEVLGLTRVGLDDDFFALGGHSMAGAKLHSRIAETCHVDVPFDTVFQHPTLREMAQKVLQLQTQHSTIGRDATRTFMEGVT